jgi:hypothetical protein
LVSGGADVVDESGGVGVGLPAINVAGRSAERVPPRACLQISPRPCG